METISYPDELKALFSNREFLINIRKYNTLPSFASLSCNRVKFDRHGPFCYKIHGSVYTQISQSATTDEGKLPRNGQIYFIDSDELKEVYNQASLAKANQISTLQGDISALSTQSTPSDMLNLKRAELQKLREEQADVFWGCDPSTLSIIFALIILMLSCI